MQSSDWVQLGLNIDGEAEWDKSGQSILLPSDGSVLVVGAPNHDPSCCDSAGHVPVFKFNGATKWTQLGLVIHGEAEWDKFGSEYFSILQVVMTVPDMFEYSNSMVLAGINSISALMERLLEIGLLLAVGAWFNDPSGHTDAGYVQVFLFNGNGWTQLGLNIDGEANGDRSGSSVSLSSDGRVLTVGAPYYGEIESAGHVRIFQFIGTGWTRLGLNIGGVAASDLFGRAASLSSNDGALSVWVPYAPSGLINSGSDQIYKARSYWIVVFIQ
eukprot:CCRYP_008383-RA/>CCRYP_008383-RA protein AED:0.15 eAED:0.25 QI:0/0/0/1/1/1/3/0/270